LVTFTVFTSLGSVFFLTTDRLIFIVCPMKYPSKVTLGRTVALMGTAIAICTVASMLFAIQRK
jgi:hypothetical protein